MRIRLLLGLSVLLLASWGCSFGPAEFPREQAIRDAWQTLQPVPAGPTYSTAPTLTAPYDPGVLDAGFLTDAVNMVSFVRFLAGVPRDVVLDPTLTAWAQAGAMLMAVSDSTERSPPDPPGMDPTLLNLARTNILYAILGSGLTSLADAVSQGPDGWMRGGTDLSTNQAATRRWILNPALYQLGFGFAESAASTPYASLEARDTSRSSIPAWDYVAWPSGDSFPVEFFAAGDPWTITLNPDEYSIPTVDRIVVTLDRFFVGPTWTLTWEDVNPAGEYLAVSTEPYGVANCIIFRPGPSVKYSAGDWFNVKVEGLRPMGDAPAELSFNVRFFSLN